MKGITHRSFECCRTFCQWVEHGRITSSIPATVPYRSLKQKRRILWYGKSPEVGCTWTKKCLLLVLPQHLEACCQTPLSIPDMCRNDHLLTHKYNSPVPPHPSPSPSSPSSPSSPRWAGDKNSPIDTGGVSRVTPGGDSFALSTHTRSHMVCVMPRFEPCLYESTYEARPLSREARVEIATAAIYTKQQAGCRLALPGPRDERKPSDSAAVRREIAVPCARNPAASSFSQANSWMTARGFNSRASHLHSLLVNIKLLSACLVHTLVVLADFSRAMAKASDARRLVRNRSCIVTAMFRYAFSPFGRFCSGLSYQCIQPHQFSTSHHNFLKAQPPPALKCPQHAARRFWRFMHPGRL
ncbi:hypothetical protein BJ546DRAFT_377582 [Cryomyces antarcticus]